MRKMLITIFDGIKDPRKIDRCTYELGDLLAIALLTFLSGCDDYADMALFARHQARKFGLLPYTDKNPSQDTFERLFSLMPPKFVEKCIVEHGKRIMDTMNEKQIAIDGKKLCGTAPKLKDEKGDYLLHAFAVENSLLLGQEKVENKENEIPACPRLIDKVAEAIEIEGATVSSDAMGAQVNIVEKILEKKAHYFLAIKENQKGLLNEIQDVMKYNQPLSVHTTTEKDHARVETRTTSIYPAEKIEDKEILNKWKGLKTLVRIDTERILVSENGKVENQTRYYISDEDFPLAQYYGEIARGHWGIENGLHWHLDITFKEDGCRARKKNAAQNLSLLRKLALQIARHTQDKLSLRKRLRQASWNPEYLITLLKNYGF